jgi:hypothetical protein
MDPKRLITVFTANSLEPDLVATSDPVSYRLYLILFSQRDVEPSSGICPSDFPAKHCTRFYSFPYVL